MATTACVKKTCKENQYWRQDLCKCITHLSMESLKHPPSQNDKMFKGKSAGKGVIKSGFKTGGMVNSNTKVSAIKTPGSKGTKVNLNKRVAKPKGKKC
jgi:hypothetical protein